MPTWLVVRHTNQLRHLPSARHKMTTDQKAMTVLYKWELGKEIDLMVHVRSVISEREMRTIPTLSYEHGTLQGLPLVVPWQSTSVTT